MNPINDVKALGTILCVFAHPDDETFTMGGVIAAAARNGQRIICVTATHGEGGVQDERRWPAATLGEIRATELEEALKILGVAEHYWLDYADGACTSADAEAAAQKIVTTIRTSQPDSIFSFGPDGLTGHHDHRAVSSWTSKAKELAGSSAPIYHAVLTHEQWDGFAEVDKQLNWFFNISEPPTIYETDAALCLHLDDQAYDQKIRALSAMPSQYDKLFSLFDTRDLRGGFGVEAFVRA